MKARIAVIILFATIGISLTRAAEVLCSGGTSAALEIVTIAAKKVKNVRELSILDCSYPQGLKITSNQPTATMLQTQLAITNTKVSQTLDISLLMGMGSSITIVNLQGVTTAPTVSLSGSLMYSASLSVADSSMGAVTASLLVSSCASVAFLRSSMTQLALPAAASLTDSASFVVQSSSVATVAGAGQLDAIRVACVMVDSKFELWNSTVIGDIQAGVTFDSSAITTVAAQGTNNVINISSNTLTLRSTTATINGAVIKQYVLGFNAPAAITSPSCYLRGGTLLSITANTLFSFVPNSNLPLMYVYSLGAMVAHDGLNKGTGGRLEFVIGGNLTTSSFAGSQLILRNYLSLLSIVVTFLVPFQSPTLLVDSSSADTMSLTSSYTSTNLNVLVTGSTITTLSISCYTLTDSSVVLSGLTTAFSLITSYFTTSTLELNGCVVAGITFAGISTNSVVLVRDSKMTTMGLRIAGTITGTTFVFDKNEIFHSTGDAIFITASVSGGCLVSFLRNSIKCFASASYYSVWWTGSVTGSNIIFASNTGVLGGFYHSGDITGSGTCLNMTGNVWNPAISASPYIFYISSIKDGARLFVDDSNRFNGGRPVSVSMVRTAAATVSETGRVYFYIANSVINNFIFNGIPSTVLNTYTGSVVAIRSTTISGTVTINLPYANGINLLIRDSPISGSLAFTPTAVTNMNFICESSTASQVLIVGAISIAGSVASSAAIVFNKVINSQGITLSYNSACPSKAASCLFALWNSKVDTVNNALKVTGSFGSFSHLDLYKSTLKSDYNEGVHTVLFASNNPSSSASMSVIETELLCYNSGLGEDDAFAIYLPSTPMTGGFEIWGSNLRGDGMTATWSNAAIKFFWVFSNYIHQGDYGGSGRTPSNSQGGTACNTCDTVFLGGGNIGGASSVSCSASQTRTRCTHDSQYSKASYNQAVTVKTVGSCMVLPTVDASLNVALVLAPSQTVLGTVYTSGAIYRGALTLAVSASTCGDRRDRLASVRTLLRYPTTSAAALFTTVSACGGAPAATATGDVAFAPSFVYPELRPTKKCFLTLPDVSTTATHTSSVSRSVHSTITVSKVITLTLTATASRDIPLTSTAGITASRTLPLPVTETNTGTYNGSVSHVLILTFTRIRTKSPTVTTNQSISVSVNGSHSPSQVPTGSLAIARTATSDLSRSLTILDAKSESLNWTATLTGKKSATMSVPNVATKSSVVTTSETLSNTFNHSQSTTLAETATIVFTITRSANSTPSAQKDSTQSREVSKSSTMLPTGTQELSSTVSLEPIPTRTSSQEASQSISMLLPRTASLRLPATVSFSVPATQSQPKWQSESLMGSETISGNNTGSAEKTASAENQPTGTAKAPATHTISTSMISTLTHDNTYTKNPEPTQTAYSRIVYTATQTPSSSVARTLSKTLVGTQSLDFLQSRTMQAGPSPNLSSSDSFPLSQSPHGEISVSAQAVTGSQLGEISKSLQKTASPRRNESISNQGLSVSIESTQTEQRLVSLTITPDVPSTSEVSTFVGTNTDAVNTTTSEGTTNTTVEEANTTETALSTSTSFTDSDTTEGPNTTAVLTNITTATISSLTATQTSAEQSSTTKAPVPTLYSKSGTIAIPNNNAISRTVPVAGRGNGDSNDVGFAASRTRLIMVAFFDTQSIAVMAQSRCGSEGQRSLFESYLLIAPVAFWGELQGAVVGTLAVLAVIALLLVFLSFLLRNPTDTENRFTKSLVRAKAGLWLVALMALLPGIAFASVRLLSSWLPLGAASAVLIAAIVIAQPIIVHFSVPRSWAAQRALSAELSTDAASIADRFANFLVIERSVIVETSPAGLAMSPVVVWRPRQAAWAVLPFVSGVFNALLLGPVGEESNGTGLCTGLFAASAVIHAGLAVLVATARPHTTRLQNIIATISFSLTGVAAAVSAAWAAQPYQAASTSELLLLIVWCLHWLVSVARIGVEVWLLPTLADAAQANEELPKVSPAVLPTSTSLPPGSHGYDMTDSFDLDQCIVDEALSMAAEKSIAGSMTAPAAKPSSFLYRTTAWDSPLAKTPDCDAVIQSPVNSVAPNESVKEEPTTIIDFEDDPYTSSGEDEASYSAPEEYQPTADRLSRQLSMHSEDDSVSTPAPIDGGGESQVMNGDARSQINDEDEDLKQEVLDSDDDCMLFNGNDRRPHDEVVAGNVPRPQADAYFHKSEAERSGRINSSDLDSQYSDGGGSVRAPANEHASSLQNRFAINDAVANAFIYDIAEEEDLF